MDYLAFHIDINAWEGRSYEIVARTGDDVETRSAAPWRSARQVGRFPLSPSGLAARLPALRRALAGVDLGAARTASENERAVEEFAGLLYRFLFSGEIKRLFEAARARAVEQWKGLRLHLRVTAADLQPIPWEVLWDILAFDLHSLKRGLFDLQVERPLAAGASHPAADRLPAVRLRPASLQEVSGKAGELLQQADAAFYTPDFARAVELYRASLRLEPGLRQARECLARAEACLAQREPHTTVPPRAAAEYRRAWDTFTMYRFEEARRWLDKAWLLARDWGIAAWPEARAFHNQIERSLTGLANYQKGLARAQAGDLPGALEAVEQAYQADPLETYRAQLETWSSVFDSES